jgi:hypothetical protein
MNPIFRLLSREEYEKLTIGQKMVYLHALAADLEEQVEANKRQVETRENAPPVSLVRR